MKKHFQCFLKSQKPSVWVRIDLCNVAAVGWQKGSMGDHTLAADTKTNYDTFCFIQRSLSGSQCILWLGILCLGTHLGIIFLNLNVPVLRPCMQSRGSYQIITFYFWIIQRHACQILSWRETQAVSDRTRLKINGKMHQLLIVLLHRVTLLISLYDEWWM